MKYPWKWSTGVILSISFLFCALAYFVTQSPVYVSFGVLLLIMGVFVWIDSRISKNKASEKDETSK